MQSTNYIPCEQFYGAFNVEGVYRLIPLKLNGCYKEDGEVFAEFTDAYGNLYDRHVCKNAEDPAPEMFRKNRIYTDMRTALNKCDALNADI